MRIFSKLILGAILLLINAAGFAQNISNTGKEFWVGYGHHQFMEGNCAGTATPTNTQNMVLYLSAEQAATVTVTIDRFPVPWTRTYNIPANTVITTENLPKGAINAGPSGSDASYDARLVDDPPPAGNGGETIFKRRAIRIVSNVPIVAYAHIYGSVSSGATMLLPVETWGFNYTSVNSEQRNASLSYSWMYVVAKDNGTVVEITPSAKSRLGKPAGVPFQVTLQRGEIYQLIGESDCASGDGPELTGTTVRSLVGTDGICHPIAVFSGSSRTGGETFTCGTGSGRDNDMQQNFPEQTWGKRYLTATFSRSSGTTPLPSSFMTSVYKVVVQDKNTVVRRNGTVMTGIIGDKYYKFSSNGTDYIEADKPIMVAQFMSGTNTCLGGGGGGDPEMIYLSPIEQGIKRVGLYRNNREAIQVNYVTLIVPTAGLGSLRIDGSAAGITSFAHSRPGYSVAVKGWNATPPAQTIVTCDSAFNGITYGLGGAESYGYNVGTFLKNLNAVSDIHNLPDTSNVLVPHPNAFVNTPTEIGALVAYKPSQMIWRLSTISAANLTPNADVTVNNPVPVDSVMIGSAWWFRYRLPGSYTFHKADTFFIPIKLTKPVVGTFKCTDEETVFIEIIVKPTPVATFTFNVRGCGTDTVFFSSPSTTGAPPPVPIIKYKWIFPNGDTSALQNPSYVLGPGSHQVTLWITIKDGGIDDTTITVVVPPKPVAKFGANPIQVCLGQAITFSDSTVYAGITNWYWDFGNGQVVNAANGNNISITYATPGIFTVKHAVVVSNFCKSDTVTKTVTVSPKAQIAFTYPTGCLPPNGFAQFGAAATDLGGQPIVSYNWNFGDPNANAGNPNTSTLQNPSHIYTAFGTYTVTLSVVTATGCSGDTSVTITMNVSPTLAYGAINPVCVTAAPVSVANGSVTNGVPGTGFYKGPGTDSAGLFTPANAGAGIHTIWYVFTSTGGCKDSVSQTIEVYPKPAANFTFPTNVCLPTSGLVQFTNTSTLAGTGTMTYLWNFGDPNANAGNPNTSTVKDPTHIYQEGTYSIKLTATSDKGCVGDTTISATFKITPALAYPALPAVCVNVATNTVSVATATVTNGVTGTGIYKGNGTSTAGVFTPSVAGPGTHTIWYVFTTTGGCVDSISQTISVSPKPAANFTFPTNVCLPTTGLVQFTNTSTIPAPGTMTYLWNFGDPNANGGNPNTSTVKDPTHIYQEGTYNVMLTATSNLGCVGDTTIAATFKITPSLNYPALAPVCEAAPGVTISVASATVTNGVTGSGIYKGPGTSTAGNFDPSVAGSGTHTIWYVFTTTGGCVDSISQTIAVAPKPRANFTFPTGCLPTNGLVQFTNTSTIAGGGALTYLWNFGDPNANGGNPNTSTQTSPTHIYQEGTYSIKLTATAASGCTGDTTITATFKITPALAYPALTPLCTSSGVVSVATATVTNGVTGNGVYSGPGTNSAGSFNPATAGPGTHSIKYVFTTTGGCVDSITQTISVYAKPVANFGFIQLCLNDSTTFIDSSSISSGSIATRHWDFGDGTNVVRNNGLTFKKLYAAPGSYVVKMYVVSNNGCLSDTATKTVVVSPLPLPVFSVANENTLCSKDQVKLTNLNVIGDSVRRIDIYWDFGNQPAVFQTDLAPTPNKVYSFQYPVFTNPATKSVTIKWVLYSGVGMCRNEITKTITLHAMPVLSFNNLPGVCVTVPAFSIAQASATNGVTGNGVYSGPGTNAAGMFNPAVAGPGLHTIKYVFATTGGCIDSVSSNIRVFPQPVAKFGFTSVCEMDSTRFIDSSTISSGTIATWNWDFGDGTTAIRNNGNPFNKLYPGFGTYDARLTVVSDSGCTSAPVTKTVTVYPKPRVDFSLPVSVCLPGGILSITNNTTLPAPFNTALSYVWDFGDGTVSTAVNPQHVYVDSNNYVIKLTATSAQGCVADTSKSFNAFYPAPIVKFGMSDTAVCQGIPITFSDSSSAPGSFISRWVWNFGDNSADTVRNPVKIYGAPGLYPVTLRVTTPQGCAAQLTKNVRIYVQPIVDAGPHLVIIEGNSAQLKPIVNDSTLSFVWTPSIYLNNDTILRPFVTPTFNTIYKLTAKGEGNCFGSDTVSVIVLKPLTVPNAFSPNGDGINDVWNIPYLRDYPGSVVEIFNRYGQSVFRSNGYPKPWDGTHNGKPLSVGVYYYVIELKNGFKPLSGSITLLK